MPLAEEKTGLEITHATGMMTKQRPGTMAQCVLLQAHICPKHLLLKSLSGWGLRDYSWPMHSVGISSQPVPASSHPP